MTFCSKRSMVFFRNGDIDWPTRFDTVGLLSLGKFENGLLQQTKNHSRAEFLQLKKSEFDEIHYTTFLTDCNNFLSFGCTFSVVPSFTSTSCPRSKLWSNHWFTLNDNLTVGTNSQAAGTVWLNSRKFLDFECQQVVRREVELWLVGGNWPRQDFQHTANPLAPLPDKW